jgi:hypothetical protein
MKKATQPLCSLLLICFLPFIVQAVSAQTCQSYTYSNTLTGTITGSIGGNNYVGASLDISSTVDITDAELLMEIGTSITVHNGGTLTIAGSHLFSCTDMWNGIIVETGGKLILDEGRFHNSSLIEDADIAVKLDYTYYDLAGLGTANALTVNNTIFNRNRIGIDFASSMFSYHTYTYPFPYYPVSIKNSIFTCRDIPFTVGSTDWMRYEDFKNTTLTSATVYPNTPNSFSSPYIDETVYSSNNTNAYLKAPAAPKTKSEIGISMGITDLTHYNGIYKIGEPANGHGTNNVVILDNQTIGINLNSMDATINNCTFQNTAGANPNTETYGIFAYHYNEATHYITTTAPSNTPHNAFFDCKYAIKSNFFTHTQLDDNDIRSSKTQALGSVNDGLEGISIRTTNFLWTTYLHTIYARGNNIKNIAHGITLRFEDWPFYNPNPSSSVYLGNAIEVNNNYISSGNEGNIVGNPNYFCDQGINLEVATLLPSAAPPTAIPPLRCIGNQVHSARIGIRLSGWRIKKVRVLNNNIHINNNLYHGYNDAQGIMLQGCFGMGSITDNLTYNNTITGYYYYPGFSINNSIRMLNINGGAFHEVTCNQTSGTGRSHIVFDGTVAIPSIFYNNKMVPDPTNGGNIALTLSNNAKLRGRSTDTWFNDFSADADYINGGMKVLCYNAFATLSPMEIHPTLASHNPENLSFLQLTGDVYSFANSSLNYGVSYILETCGPIASRGSNSANTTNNSTQSITDSLPMQLLIDMATANTRIAGSDSALRLYVAQLQLYHFLSTNDSTVAKSQELQQFMAASKNGSFGKMEQVMEALAKHDSILVRQLLNGWTKTNRVDSNYAQFFAWSLQRGLKHPINLADVERLAQGCPQIDGDVVFLSQNLYNAIANKHRIFTSSCDATGGEIPIKPIVQVGKNAVSKSLATNTVSIYPNPTSNDVRVKGSNIAYIEVYNLYGARVYASKHYNGEVFATISIKTLVPGMYVLKVYDRQHNSSSYKLIKR